MLFNSLRFAIFLSIVFAVYWLAPHRLRWVALLTFSAYFYTCWGVKYIFILADVIIVSYLAALIVAKTERCRKLILAVAIVLCILPLFVFKYFNFAADTLSAILSPFGINLHTSTLKLIVPVGVSFFTFQATGYVIDVYRKKIKPEKHLGYYALFVSFFPQISSGPIGRADKLIPQFREEKVFDYDNAVYGLRLILIGFFKKLVVADNLAVYVDKVYGNLHNMSGFSLILAAFFYSIQIYCDFSGYTDIARGAAKLLNINLMENFRSPYFSSSVKELWSRWHISLSTWFRDYVYIPLGGNRVSKARNCVNLMVTFLLSGLWHGADWTFVMWGGVHGAAQVGEKLLKTGDKNARGIRRSLRIAAVFIFKTAAWVLFRADSISDAFYLFGNCLNGIGNPRSYISSGILSIGLTTKSILWRTLLYIVPLAVYDWKSLDHDLIAEMSGLKTWSRHIIYALLIIVITVFHAYSSSGFVYFQF